MSVYRKLLPNELPLYREHLRGLSPIDRYTRFGRAVSDPVIDDHVRRLNPATTRLVGAFHEGRLIAASELCTSRLVLPQEAEVAISVNGDVQGRGIGTQLLRRTLTLARNRAIPWVHMLCLAENRRMRAIAHRFGGRAEADGGEVSVVFDLPPPDAFSLALEALEDGSGIVTEVLDTLQAVQGRVLDGRSPGWREYRPGTASLRAY